MKPGCIWASLTRLSSGDERWYVREVSHYYNFWRFVGARWMVLKEASAGLFG